MLLPHTADRILVLDNHGSAQPLWFGLWFMAKIGTRSPKRPSASPVSDLPHRIKPVCVPPSLNFLKSRRMSSATSATSLATLGLDPQLAFQRRRERQQ